MTSTPPQRVRARWGTIGAVVWLTLASSISLELGEPAAAKWGSGAALTVIGLLLLAMTLRMAVIPIRHAIHRTRRRGRDR